MPALAGAYERTRRATEALCARLTVEDHNVQSMTDASPAKWHMAHTTWFFETFLLAPHLPGYAPLDPAYRSLFNSYYNAVGSRPERSLRGVFSRPSLDEVRAFRRHVDAHMMTLLAAPVSPELEALVVLGMNHEQQHQELILTDILHAFWNNPLRPAYTREPRPTHTSPGPVRWHDYPGGLREIGHSGSGFAFDNESPRHKVYLEPFRLASRLVTAGEYRVFMDDGGYRRPELWLSDAWDTVRAQNWIAPLYWEKSCPAWQTMGLHGMRPLSDDEPACHISFYEADAFARWAGARLPTEIEWEVAASEAELKGNFVEDGNFVAISAPQQASHHPQQLFGDVWEWTASPYVAYPGYRPAAGALGEYNSKFMCNQMVLRGGSCATPRSHIRASYRNFFPPQARWQFSGIRLAKDP